MSNAADKAIEGYKNIQRKSTAKARSDAKAMDAVSDPRNYLEA